MKKPQAMMFYPEAWKGSTGVAAMAPAARAGYFDILCSIWLSGGSLPDDDRTLQACSRLEAKDWKRHRAAIRAELVVIDGGRISQRRVIEEYERTVDLLDRRSKGGKKGARNRWANDGSPNGSPNGLPTKTPNGTPDAKPMQTETETETRSPIPNGIGEGERASAPARAPDPSPPEPIKPPEPSRNPFGEFGNVRLSESEHEKLVEKLGHEGAAAYIEALDAWIAENPADAKRKNRQAYPTILNWHRRDLAEGKTRTPKTRGSDGPSRAFTRTEQRRQETHDALREAARRLAARSQAQANPDGSSGI